MYNKAILMGRICNDLELKTTPSGVSVLSFRISVDRSYQAKGEERKSDFFNVVAWRANAEFISRYFSKGRMILVEGELQTRQYVDKNNSTVTVTELVVDSASFTGEKKADNTTDYTPTNSAPSNTDTAAQTPQQTFNTDMTPTDDDYPF